LNEGFQWLASWTAIICFGAATVFEILAYYIPVVDNLLDIIAVPLSIGAGTLLFSSVLPIDNELLRWGSGFMIGGGTAASVQAGTLLLRLASTKLTAGIGNAFVATGEHAAAFGTSIFSLFIPVIVAVIIILFIVFILLISAKRLSARRRV